MTARWTRPSERAAWSRPSSTATRTTGRRWRWPRTTRSPWSGRCAAATLADLGIARYTEKGVADPAGLVRVDFHGGDTARDSAFDADGNVVVVGWTQNGQNTEMVAVRTAP